MFYKKDGGYNYIMKKFKKILIWSIICISVGCLITLYIINSKNKGSIIQKVPVAISQLSDIKNIYKKLKMGDIITKKITSANNLITTEVELSQTITLDSSWGSLSIFKKVQKIHFYGTGIYTEDMSSLSKNDIIVDNKKNIVTVKVPKPQVKMVTIDESKTEYEPVDKGFLRFGSIKLLPSENEIMLQEMKKRMTDEMQNSDNYTKALENTKDSVKNMIKNIITNYAGTNYDINIVYKD